MRRNGMRTPSPTTCARSSGRRAPAVGASPERPDYECLQNSPPQRALRTRSFFFGRNSAASAISMVASPGLTPALKDHAEPDAAGRLLFTEVETIRGTRDRPRVVERAAAQHPALAPCGPGRIAPGCGVFRVG